MSRKPRILFSSRDPGGAGHISILLQAFRKDGRFEVDLVASGVALAMFQKLGESPRAFAFQDGRDHLQVGEVPTPLMDAARRLLEEARPDAVFTCLSTLGVGIDEALVAACQVPSFVMQDFWGDVNLGLGVPAGLYFVLDDYAARLTRERWGVDTVAVGSSKHSSYTALDVMALRHRARRSIAVSDDEKVIGYFGQSPDLPGQEAAFQDLVKAMGELKPQPLCLLREHPKFLDSRKEHVSLAHDAGLMVADVTGEPDVEGWLAACDVVTTHFSACALDHAYLSAYATRPIGTVLYLLSNQEIQEFAAEACGFPVFPTVDQGLGTVVKDTESIVPLLTSALREPERAAYFGASKGLQQWSNPCQAIVDTVFKTLSMEDVPQRIGRDLS